MLMPGVTTWEDCWFVVKEIAVPFFGIMTPIVVAVFTALAIRVRRGQVHATVLHNCLQTYLQIQRNRSEAITANSATLVKDAYREAFDLYWSELQLLDLGLLPRRVMEAWLLGLHRMLKGSVSIAPQGQAQHIPW